MQQHQQETDKRIDEVFRRLDEGNAKPKQSVFYNGQVYDAYTFVSDLIKSAKRRIILIDNYVDETVLTLLDKMVISIIVEKWLLMPFVTMHVTLAKVLLW